MFVISIIAYLSKAGYCKVYYEPLIVGQSTYKVKLLAPARPLKDITRRHRAWIASNED